MARFVVFTLHCGDPVYVKPDSVVLVMHSYSNGKMIQGTRIFQTDSDDPLIVKESPDVVVARLEHPND